MTESILLGTQSWNFKAWCGPFYPPGTRASEMLGFYGLNFPVLEVDSTFYGVPAEPILSEWIAQVPPTFRFAVKVPQQITHDARLVGVERPIEEFIDRISVFGDQLAACLIQLSPDYVPTPENRAAFRAFVQQLPGSVRWAVEFRHVDWSDSATLDLLGKYGVAHALVDGRWYPRPRTLELARTPTADFTYVRWMGTGRRFSDYSRPQADRETERGVWADTLRQIAGQVRHVFGFFNNQFEGHSPFSVREMQRALGHHVVDPQALHPQGELFSQ